MNALGIAMVKNEADIIEASVRHNLAYLDLLVVIDNASTDGTREILDALRQEGLPLLIFDDPVFGHFQSEKVTHVYRKVVPIFQPELVYLLDADEFIRAPDRATLEGALQGVPPGHVVLLPWMTYVPTPEVDAAQLLRDPLGAVTHRRRREEPLYYKALIRRQPADDALLIVEQGNHGVHLADGRSLPLVRLDGVAIAHLPVRSAGQLSAKVINGWHACLVRNRTRDVPGEAFQWQNLYEQIIAGHDIAPATLVDTALNYAQQPRAGRSAAQDLVDDPMPAHYGTLQHLPLGRHSALAKVALSMASYLHQERPLPGHGEQPAMDLAPALDLLRASQARSLAVLSENPAWAARLAELRPGLQVRREAPVDLLLCPALPHAACMAHAGELAGMVSQRLVYWPDAARGPHELNDELLAWQRHGWAPQLMQTMAYRALATYASQRQGAIVLHKADPASAAKADVVRELLCSLASLPSPWQDPAADCIRHPLQALQLGTQPA